MTPTEDVEDDITDVQEVYAWGLTPDPDLTVDEWADKYMVISKASGAKEAGPYRTARTPHAREIMRCLSHTHPCHTVVAKVGSQMFKTQIALNFICSIIHQTPANILLTMPTGKLHKRIADRIDKTFAEVPPVRELVAPPRSRDAKNTQDIKHFRNGSLYIATAGAAANLAEIAVRFFLFDEVDRAPRDVDGEGDAIKLGENRTSTFSNNRKMYYYSSPTGEGESRIDDEYERGTRREPLAECVHCGHMQKLDFFKLIPVQDGRDVAYPCEDCGALLYDSDKPLMFAKGAWTPPNPTTQNGVESFTASAMFSPYGWVTWLMLYNEYQSAHATWQNGDDEMMKVFYNTRLALTWSRNKETTSHEALQNRAEQYLLGYVPKGGVVITAAVDVQENRLEYACCAWGLNMECWVVDYQVLDGDPNLTPVWSQLVRVIRQGYPHVGDGGDVLFPAAVFVDSGGHHTQIVYNFARKHRKDKVFAIKGSSTIDAPIIAKKPSKPDVSDKGHTIKKGVELWIVGPNSSKDMIAGRLPVTDPPGAIHMSEDLPESWFMGLVSEYRVSKKLRGRKVGEWVQRKGKPNEPLDLMVYNLAAAYKLNLHQKTETWWARELDRLDTKQTEEGTAKAQPPKPEGEQRKPAPRRAVRRRGLRDKLKAW